MNRKKGFRNRPVGFSFLFLLLLVGIVPSPVSAQVATSSLDPTEKSLMPAAISWRFSSTIGASMNLYSTGEYTDSQGVKTNELTRSALEGLLAHQFEEVTVEYTNSPEFKEVRTNLTTNETFTYKNKADRLNLAYRFGDSYSLGAVYRTWKKESDYTNSVGRDHETGAGEKTIMGLGGSLRLADFFFLAVGLEETTHKQSGFEANKWMDQLFGLGLLGEGVFRLEYAKIFSPESVTAGTVSHSATDNTLMSLEVKYDIWLLRYQKEEYVVTPIGSGTSTTYEYTTLGIGMAPEEGLVLTAALINGKQGDAVATTDYRLSLAFNYW